MKSGKKISTCLNSTSAIRFTVNKRSVRDRLTLLINKYREKMNKEEKGSAITRDDETEVEIAVAEIIEKERAADLERKYGQNSSIHCIPAWVEQEVDDEMGSVSGHGEGRPYLRIYTLVDLLGRRRTVADPKVGRNLPASPHRVYVPLKSDK